MGIICTHLSFGQTEHFGQLGFPRDGNVSVEMEFFFELQTLQVGVYHPVFIFGACSACKNEIRKKKKPIL